MNSRATLRLSAVAVTAHMTALAMGPARAIDAAAAESIARQNGCLKCHATDKTKEGPSFKEIAAKYKGKPGAEERLITHITTGEKAKFADGHEEEHKIIKAKEPETRNLIQWILSL